MNNIFTINKNEGEVKKELLDDLKKVSKQYQKKYPDTKHFVTRDYYRQYGRFSEKDYAEIFGSFGNFKEQTFTGIKPKKGYHRDQINVTRDYSQITKKRYFVSSIIAGAPVDTYFMESVINYCNVMDAELILIPMRGEHKNDSFDPGIYNKYRSYFATEITFNDNLKALDLKLNPTQKNPLTGLKSIGHKSLSLIVASPKQDMELVPVSNRTLPHMLHSTGCINSAFYSDDRIGIIAQEDHVIGGLIIEIQDSEIFHIRQVQGNIDGSFSDLDINYSGNSVIESNVEAFVMGDYHSGSECPETIKIWKECIRLTDPEFIIFHDLLDCKSINKYEENNITYRATLPDYAKTLRDEFNYIGESLETWSDEFPDSTLVITKGNHDMWLDDYLQQGKYARPEEAHNHLFALDLAKLLIYKKNPLAEYIKSHFDVPNIIWLGIDDDFILSGVQCGAHGSIGSNGTRGSIVGMENQYGNCIVGHSHSPRILRQAVSVGTSTKLNLGYNAGGGSSWLNSSCILFKGGQKQIISNVEGSWKI